MLLARVAGCCGGTQTRAPIFVQRRRIRRIPAAFASALLAAGTPASEAAAGAAGSPPMDELTVTSPRTAKSLVEVPAAISVVERQAIQRGRPQVDLGEALQRVPGLVIRNRSNFAQDLRIAIRGFGARSSFGIRGIRVLVDGIPATLPDGQTQVDNIDLASAERIEVIRGPSSSLYGAAAGGVIRIESESAPEQPFVSGRFAIGEYGFRKYQAKAGGRLGPFDYLLSLSRLEVDGYRDHSRSENILLNSRFRFRIDETSDVGLVFNNVHSPTADDPGGLTAMEVRSDRRQAAPRNLLFDTGESVDQQQLGLVYAKRFGEHHEIEAHNHYVWRQFDNRLPFESGGSVDLDRFFAGGGLRYVYAARPFGRENRLMLGFEVDAQRDVRKRFDNDAGSRGDLRLDQDENVTSFGLYAQDELRLLEDLELTVGLRYDRVDFDVDDGFESDGDDGGDLLFDEVSPRAGLVWSPHPAVHVFANVSTSFETPTTTELANPGGEGGFDPDLDAQTAVGYELGLKGFVAGRLSYEVVGFHIDVEDELVPFEVPSMPGREFFENAGRSKRSGLELALALQPCDGLTTSLAYTFSHFRFDRFRTPAGSFDGNDIPGIPRHQVWAEIAYDHPWGFYAAWEILYADGVYADNANRVKSDGYVVANLRAGFKRRFGGWELGPFLGVRNLFDEKYLDNVRLNAGFGRSFEPAPEVNVYGGVALGYRFGEP
jgi:iron complex outermembrane receptor protein